MVEVAPAHRPVDTADPHPLEKPGVQGANGDVGDSSRNLLASVNELHVQSQARNSQDSTKDREAIKGDQDSIKLAGKTGGLADVLQAYIARGGDFSDAKGQALGKQFIAALRQERTDHIGDRATDLQYAGAKGISPQQRHDTLAHGKSIGEDAVRLADPETSAADRAKIIQDIAERAQEIGATVADKTGKAGSDQKDAASESRVIAADAAALKSGKLTPEQSAALVADIASKSQLIAKEINDAPNETRYAQNDSDAIKAGATLEAVVKSAMQSHSPKAMQQLAGLVDKFHNSRGEGVLDHVSSDRRQDLRLEPTYIAANDADNTKDNKGIIEFTNPYAVGHK